MTENLQRALEVLCEELGLPVPSSRPAALNVEGNELKIVELPQGKAALLGTIGSLSQITEKRRESVETVLSRCLTLHGARFSKLGTREAVTLDDHDQLVLWSGLDADTVSISEFIQTSESMLNELEFWKGWLSAA